MSKRKYYDITIAQRVMLPMVLAGLKEHDFLNISPYITLKNEKGSAEALEKAFNWLLKDNEALRTRLVFRRMKFMQYIADFEYVQLDIIHLNSKDELMPAMRQRRSIKRPLRGYPLYCAALFTYDDKITLMMDFHHGCYDGYSIGLTYRYVIEAYNAYMKGEEPVSTVKKQNLVEFFEKDAKLYNSARHQRDLEYWKKQLDVEPVIQIPFHENKSKEGVSTRDLEFINDKYDKIADFCKNTGISHGYFMVMVALLTIAKMKNLVNVNIAQMTHQRNTAALKNTIGDFAHIFNVIANVDRTQSVVDFAISSYRNYLESMRHSSITTFENIKLSKKIRKETGEINLYGVMISLLDLGEEDATEDYEVGVIPHYYQPQQMYNTIRDNRKDRISISSIYQKAVISEEKMSSIVECYTRITTGIINGEYRTIEDIMNSNY